MLVHRDALVVRGVTAKGVARWTLSGVLFDALGRAVATDGHLLVRFLTTADVRGSFGDLDTAKAEAVIVDADALAAAAATMNGGEALAVVPNGDTVTMATSGKGAWRAQVTCPKQVGEFPAYKKMLTPPQPVRARVVLDPDIMFRLAAIVQQIGAKDIEFTLYAPEGQAVITDRLTFIAHGKNGTLDGAWMPR